MSADTTVSTYDSGDRTWTHRASHVVPSVVRCGLYILGIDLALRTAGFDRTIRWIHRHVRSVSATAATPMEVVKRAEFAVAMAAALYPGRARCLVQSLVLYVLLRRKGVAVRYRQGIVVHPFGAHAWVEYRGDVINDVPEHVDEFAPLPDQLP